MSENPDSASDSRAVTALVMDAHYVIGVGETIDEMQATGQWIATDTPIEITC